MYDVIIIGAGPSGIMASISSKLNNKNVLLLEKNNTIGKKILLTGNGRGNFTNLFLIENDYNNPSFVNRALSIFDNSKVIDFFYNLGMPYRTEQIEGRCYPLSDQASSIVEILTNEIKRLKIDLKTNSEVLNIKHKNEKFIVTLKNSVSYTNKNIIISTGGLTYPVVGTTGDGYLFAKEFNHTITPLYPALTRIHLKGNFKDYKGVRLTRNLRVFSNDLLVKEFYGDIIFNDYGIGGIASFDVSKDVNLSLANNNKTIVSIELAELKENKLKEMFNLISYKSIYDSLIGLVPKKLIPLVVNKALINSTNILIRDLTADQLNNLINTLKSFSFEATNTDSYPNAQITIGGINLKEINKDTLESKYVKGLYFT